MEYLITGGAGFIGSKICERLEILKKDYIVVDDLSKGNIQNIINKDRFLKIDCSSEEFEILVKNRTPKHIMHLCGQSSGERSYENPSNDFIRNVLTTRRLISGSEHNKNLQSLSFASSMSVYGNRLLAKESDLPNPISWYGKHKYLSENLIKDFAQYRKEVKCNSLRLFNVYGNGQDLDDLKQGMVSIFISMAIRDGFINIKGSGERIRDFINVKDVVEAFLLSSNREIGGNYEIFNIGCGKSVEISKIVEIITSKIDSKYCYQNERTPFDQDFCSADISKSRSILNFIPKNKLESELIEMINWAKKIL